MIAQHTAATVRTNSNALTNCVLRSLKCASLLELLSEEYSPQPALGEHLKGQVGRLNLTMRIQHLHTENKRVRTTDLVFGNCHYRKVYSSRKLNQAKECLGLSESY